jgi:hypothetical protein
MENRERDRVSQRTSPTEAGRINREVEEEKGREQNSGTSAEFGQSIGRSENLEGGEMNNSKNRNRNTEMENESSRRSGSEGFGSSSGRSSSMDRDRESSISRDDKSPSRSGSVRNNDSSEGRH